MKFTSKKFLASVLTLGVILFGPAQGQAQILLKVDTTKPWQGYMNVFNLPDYSGGYVFGSPWGAADLTAYVTGTSTLTLMPNTNTYDATSAFWVKPDGSGNKFMEANFYVENTGLRGQTVTFNLTVNSNNLYGGTGGHLTRAFVKTLDSGAGYSLVPG